METGCPVDKMVKEGEPNSLPSMTWPDRQLLDVSAAIHDVRDQIADWSIVHLDGNPGVACIR